MGVRISLSTGSLYGTPLDRSLALIAELGLDGAEILLTGSILAAGPADLDAMARRHGVPILSIHFPILGHQGEADLLDAYERTADFAAEIGTCEAVVVHTTTASLLHSTAGNAYMQSLARCRQRLRSSRATLTLENRGVTSIPSRPAYLDDLVHLRRLAEEWDLGLTYDVGHAASWGLDICRAFETLRLRTVNVHLSNSLSRGWPASAGWLRAHLRDHQPLDAGVLPIDELLEDLAGSQYDGLVTLELSPIALHLPWPWQARERLAKSVARCQAAFATAPRRQHDVRFQV